MLTLKRDRSIYGKLPSARLGAWFMTGSEHPGGLATDAFQWRAQTIDRSFVKLDSQDKNFPLAELMCLTPLQLMDYLSLIFEQQGQ